MRLTPWLLAIGCTAGCGYHLVTPDAAAPAGPLEVGTIDDLTADGDLGLYAAHRLRGALAARLAPDAPRLDGTIRPAGDLPLAFDRDRLAAARTAGVELELRLIADDGDPLWTSGPITRTRPCFRGDGALDDRAARRDATRRALDDALADALARLASAEPR